MKVIEEEPEKLVLEITGETHTICNILRKRLMAQDDIKSAAYDITHPLIGQPEFEINSPNPRDSVDRAANEIKQEAIDFKKVLIENFEE